MSKLNGNRARFQIDRVRKLLRRQRIKALLTGLISPADGAGAAKGPEAPATAEGAIGAAALPLGAVQ